VAALIVAYPPVATGITPDCDDDQGVWTGWEHGRRVQQEIQRAGLLGDDPFVLQAGAAARLIRTASTVMGWDTSHTLDVVGVFTAELAQVLLMRLRRQVGEAKAAAGARARGRYPDDYEPTEEELRQLW
jgi:hypothetical protein